MCTKGEETDAKTQVPQQKAHEQPRWGKHKRDWGGVRNENLEKKTDAGIKTG